MSLKNQACRGACVASVAASEQVACQGACVAEHWTALPDLTHKAPRWLARKQKRRHKSAAAHRLRTHMDRGAATAGRLRCTTWVHAHAVGMCTCACTFVCAVGMCMSGACAVSVLWACVGMRVPAIQDLEMQVEYNANLARAAPYALHSARCMPHAVPHAARRTPHSALCTLQAEYNASLSLRDACAVFFTDDKSRLRTTTLTPSH